MARLSEVVLTTTEAKPIAQLKPLEVLEGIESYLIPLVGYELWTPLSTLQVTLESLASSGKMPTDSRQQLLDTASSDLLRLCQLIQDSLSYVARLQTESVALFPLSDWLELSGALESVLQNTLRRRLESSRLKSMGRHRFRDEPPQIFP